MLTAQWYNGLWSRPISGMFRLRPRPAPPGRPLQLVVQPRPGPRPSADARLAHRHPCGLHTGQEAGALRSLQDPPAVSPGQLSPGRRSPPLPPTPGTKPTYAGVYGVPVPPPTTTGQMLCPAQHWALLAWVWVGRVRGHQESRVEGLRRGRRMEATAPHWRGRPMTWVAPA